METIHFESSHLPKLRVNEHKEAIFGAVMSLLDQNAC